MVSIVFDSGRGCTQFFQEVQRYISIAPSVMRKTTQDVEYDGESPPTFNYAFEFPRTQCPDNSDL